MVSRHIGALTLATSCSIAGLGCRTDVVGTIESLSTTTATDHGDTPTTDTRGDESNTTPAESTDTDTSNVGSTSGDTSGPTDTGSSTSTSTGAGPNGCFHAWTFDSCPSDWQVGKVDVMASASPSWQCGDPPAAISLGGTHTGVWATNLAGEYPELESSYLMSPPFSLADCSGATVYLTFAHLYDFGSSDGGTVQVSNDGGTSWQTIETLWNGYCGGMIDGPFTPPAGEPGFCGGDDELWLHTLADLAPWGGEPEVRIRFVFGSDDIIERLGWYIDSVATEAYR